MKREEEEGQRERERVSEWGAMAVREGEDNQRYK